MAGLITPEKREKLFRQCQHMLGAPIRAVELTDEMMDTAMEIRLWYVRTRLVNRKSMGSFG